MSHQYQPTFYYDWPSRNHGITLEGGVFKYTPYEYYAGDQIHHQNTVFRDCEYVTHDNTHARFLNASDIHLYDTSGIKVFDSGTLTMYTSASPDSRGFIVDQIGRVGIGMDHTEPHSNGIELPSFDLDVKGQVGVEDYIYHNDDVDTYMLFGSDLSAHNVNEDGSSNTIYPDDQDEINFRVGGIDMLQMQSRDVDHVESGVVPVSAQDHVTFNKYQTDVDFVVRSETNTGAFVVSGDGVEVVVNEDGNADTDFRVESDHEDHMLFVDTSVNRISIGDSEDTPQATLEVTNDPDSGAFDVPLVQLNNEDTDKQLLDINAKNIDADVISVSADDLVSADVISVTADSLTTGDVINATADSLTTGSLIHMTHTGSDKSEVSLVHFESTGDRGDDSNQTVLLDLNFDTTDGTGARALRIDSEQTTGYVVEVDASEVTTGRALDITGADSLTTGKIAYFSSNSPSTGGRNLVQIQNDNELATGTRALYIKNNAIASGSEETVRIESTAADTNPLVELRNSNSAIDTPPVLNFKVTNYTGESTHLDLGTLKFEGQASPSSARVVYAALSARATDMHTDEFGGQFNFMVQATDSPAQLRNMLSIGGQANTSSAVDTQAEVVINEDQIDLDFRVESNTTDNAFIVYGDGTEVVVNENGNSDTDFRVESDLSDKILFVDASADHVDIRGPANDDTDLFTIHGNGDNDAGGHELLSITPVDTIFNDDGNDIDFRVESQTNTHALYIDGAGSEVVVNDTGRNDTDFRVESAKSSHMLWVDTSTDSVQISGAGNDNTDIFHVKGNSDDGQPGAKLLSVSPRSVIVNDDANDVDFRIESQTNTKAVFVYGDGSEVVINENGQSDTDFRVESNVSPASATDSDTSGGHIGHKKSHAFFVDTSTGKVGLGVSTPETTLHVAGSAQIEGDLWVKGITNQVDTLVHVTSAMDITNAGTGPALKVTQNGAQPVAAFYDGNDQGAVQFPALYIENGNEDGPGNIGIGTANPDADLHVNKASNIEEDLIFRLTQNNATFDPVIQLYGNSDSDSEGLEIWYDNDTGEAHMATLQDASTSSLIFHTRVDSKGTGNERFRIDGDGNIGINKSTPWTKMYIEATDGIRVPVGTTAQRPTSAAFGLGGSANLGKDPGDGTGNTVNADRMLGTIRYNTDQSTFEGFGPGYKWGSLGGVIDVDRDTYWTAVNDLENIHEDEFDDTNEDGTVGSTEGYDDYPGDTDALRGFTDGKKRIQIDKDGDLSLYRYTGGAGTIASKYKYEPHLKFYSVNDGSNPVARIDESWIKSTQSMHLDSPKQVQIVNHNGTDTGLQLSSTLVKATGAELNIMDGDSTINTVTIHVSQDGFVMNDNGVMKQVSSAKLRDFAQGGLTGSRAVITNSSGNLAAANVTSTELGVLDGDATASTAAVQGSDRLVMNDNGTMTQVPVSAVMAYDSGAITAMNNLVSIGTTANTTTIAGSAHVGSLGSVDSSISSVNFKMAVGGNVRADGDVVAYATSDERLKDNVMPITDPIYKLGQLGGYEFDWNDAAEFTGHDVGVLAQEVEQVLPEIVTTRDSGYKAVKYEKIVPLLIECVKDQQKQINELKELIARD